MEHMLWIYNMMSISVLIPMIYLIFNFDLTILLGQAICTFLQYCIKEITRDWYPPIFKRPDGATDCSLFNTGGCMDTMPGFPSGHVASISVFIETLLLNSKHNNVIYYILYRIPILMVAYARIMKRCHNIIQVIAGYILGYVVANVLYRYNDNIINYTKRCIKYI